MKATKTVKKNKKFTPIYTVDITECDDVFDVRLQFAKAKQKAGLAISDDELNAIVNEAICDFAEALLLVGELCDDIDEPKKQPWYKRFWNWIKHPFKKK